MSMEKIGAGLRAARGELPLELLAAAIERLDVSAAQYIAVLDGSGMDTAEQIKNGLAQARRSLTGAAEALHVVSEDTVRYMAAIGLRDTIEQPHVVARTKINAKMRDIVRTDLSIANLERVSVPDEIVSWQNPAPDYHPPYIDIPRGLSSARKPDDHPDPADPAQISSFTAISGEAIARDAAGRPLNPAGRTGIAGRGILNKWAENPAADLILTRDNPETGVLEVAVVQRADAAKDTEEVEWALPGGKVDPGESPRQAALREFCEEAGGEGMTLDMDTAQLIYAGYIDDSRNTDNAWMVSSVFYRHLSPEEANRLTLRAGSDATKVAWRPTTIRFFASHGDLVQRAERLRYTGSA